MQARTGISERRACQLIGLSRSVLRYQPRASVQNTELQAQLVELAQERRRFGYRRLHILLRRAGVQVNHKRIYRLYRAAGLMVKRRRRRHGVAVERERLSLPVLHGRTAFCANELREMRRLNFDGHGRLRAELELGFKVGL